MKLRRRLIEARAARDRVAHARRHSACCASHLKRHVENRPLTSVTAAGGTALVAGFLTGRRGKGVVFGLYRDPALRWLLRLLGPMA